MCHICTSFLRLTTNTNTMKKIIGILLCLTLVSCERIISPTDNQNISPIRFKQDIYPTTDSTFYVENDTHINLGSVTVKQGDSSNIYINVPDSGRYTARALYGVMSCSINSQSLAYGSAQWIVIDSHTAVHATWTSNFIVVDRSEQN